MGPSVMHGCDIQMHGCDIQVCGCDIQVCGTGVEIQRSASGGAILKGKAVKERHSCNPYHKRTLLSTAHQTPRSDGCLVPRPQRPAEALLVVWMASWRCRVGVAGRVV